MTALEKMAKAIVDTTEADRGTENPEYLCNRVAIAVLDALITHLKGGAPELVEAFRNGQRAYIDGINKANDDPGARVLKVVTDAGLVNSGLIAFCEAAKEKI